MRSAFIFATAVFVVYLFSAFVAADFNFANWSMKGRLVVACIAAVFGISAVGYPYERHN